MKYRSCSESSTLSEQLIFYNKIQLKISSPTVVYFRHGKNYHYHVLTNTEEKSNPNENDDTSSNNDEQSDAKNKLPKTSTNMYNWIFIGSSLIVLVFIILLTNKRRKRSLTP